MGRMKDEGEDKAYQGTVLKNFSPASREKTKQDALTDLTGLNEKMKERLEWSDTKLLRCLLVFLDTQTWTGWPTLTIDSEVHIGSQYPP